MSQFSLIRRKTVGLFILLTISASPLIVFSKNERHPFSLKSCLDLFQFGPFKNIELIGQGGYGKAYSATKKSDSSEVVIKKARVFQSNIQRMINVGFDLLLRQRYTAF